MDAGLVRMLIPAFAMIVSFACSGQLPICASLLLERPRGQTRSSSFVIIRLHTVSSRAGTDETPSWYA